MKIIFLQQEEIKYLKNKNLNLLNKIQKYEDHNIVTNETKNNESHSHFDEKIYINKKYFSNISDKDNMSEKINDNISSSKYEEEKIEINLKKNNEELKVEFQDFHLNVQYYISNSPIDKKNKFDLERLQILEVKGNINFRTKQISNNFKITCDKEFSGCFLIKKFLLINFFNLKIYFAFLNKKT